MFFDVFCILLGQLDFSKQFFVRQIVALFSDKTTVCSFQNCWNCLQKKILHPSANFHIWDLFTRLWLRSLSHDCIWKPLAKRSLRIESTVSTEKVWKFVKKTLDDSVLFTRLSKIFDSTVPCRLWSTMYKIHEYTSTFKGNGLHCYSEGNSGKVEDDCTNVRCFEDCGIVDEQNQANMWHHHAPGEQTSRWSNAVWDISPAKSRTYCPSTSMTSSLALASALASPGGGAPASPASPGGGVDPVLA